MTTPFDMREAEAGEPQPDLPVESEYHESTIAARQRPARGRQAEREADAVKAIRSLRILNCDSARGCPFSSSRMSSRKIIGAPSSTPTRAADCSSAAVAP